MRKKIVGVLIILLAVGIATGIVFADTIPRNETAEKTEKKDVVQGVDECTQTAADEVNFTAKLWFVSKEDKQVYLILSNCGKQVMTVSSGAYYMDQIGSAGSRICDARADTEVKPGQTKRICFQLAEKAPHGDNSILAFFFEYGGQWYLGKTGRKNGIEYFLKHN